MDLRNTAEDALEATQVVDWKDFDEVAFERTCRALGMNSLRVRLQYYSRPFEQAYKNFPFEEVLAHPLQ